MPDYAYTSLTGIMASVPNHLTKFLLLTALLIGTPSIHAMNKELHIGDTAPDFNLTDQNGKSRKLADYRGRWVVLYFYPKDDTPGCTREACAFRDDFLRFDKLHADILGISIDNQESHAEFSGKYGLPFPLLADPDGKTAAAYGSYFSFGPLRYARRHTFIIDPDGRLAKIYRKVDPKKHSDEIYNDLTRLQKAGI